MARSWARRWPNELGHTIATIDAADLHEVVFKLLPRKVSVEASSKKVTKAKKDKRKPEKDKRKPEKDKRKAARKSRKRNR